MTTEKINSFIETQLSVWPEAKANFDNLAKTQRRPMPLGDFPMHLQLNPARIRSTAAAVDKASVAKRECFLCSKNRPQEQIALPLLPMWELLVNPYPILPVHFTIPSTTHKDQKHIPLDMVTMADMAPDLAIFFNGANAGASAPDHLHCQAVLKNELPIISLTEKYHTDAEAGWKCSEDFGLELPFQYMSAVITTDPQGMLTLSKFEGAGGLKEGDKLPNTAMVNAFAWKDKNGIMRLIVIPRKAHRPSHYFRETDNFMVSPGALDMAGLLILPREDDFERMDENTLREIFAETAFTKLPEVVKAHFK